jgi:hypothetical protein
MGGEVWSGLFWLRIGTSGEVLLPQQWAGRLHNMQGISRLAGKILPLEADLLPRQFVINWTVIWFVISVYIIIRRYMISKTESFVNQRTKE